MSLNRYAKRRDENEPELVKFARSLGFQMECHGPLDWWCFHRSKWMPVEIKRPEKEGHADEFTEQQIKFRIRCKERGAPFWVWRCEKDVLDSLGAKRSA